MSNLEEAWHDLLSCHALYRGDDTLDHRSAAVSRLVPNVGGGRGDQSVNDVST
jgi:hypothetical protein